MLLDTEKLSLRFNSLRSNKRKLFSPLILERHNHLMAGCSGISNQRETSQKWNSRGSYNEKAENYCWTLIFWAHYHRCLWLLFFFLSTALFAFRSFFSSSESEARSWDSYSQTTSQPSLFLSAILISFWRSLISCFPSATNLRTSDEFSTLPSIWVKMLFECKFNSNCSPFPLNLIAEAFFSDFGGFFQLFVFFL